MIGRCHGSKVRCMSLVDVKPPSIAAEIVPGGTDSSSTASTTTPATKHRSRQKSRSSGEHWRHPGQPAAWPARRYRRNAGVHRHDLARGDKAGFDERQLVVHSERTPLCWFGAAQLQHQRRERNISLINIVELAHALSLKPAELLKPIECR